MDAPTCCSTPDVRWKPTKVGDKYADVYACESCGHVYRTEQYAVPLQYPGFERCVNCGGAYLNDEQGNPLQCETCRLSPTKDKELHDALAAAHPEGDYLQGALVAGEIGRQVLALKLASGAVRWAGGDTTVARTVRLQALEAIGQIDRALDEAYEWAKLGAPNVIWGLIADLEGGAGNIDGATRALAYAIEVEPDNLSLWTDYAELMALGGHRTDALESAKRGLVDVEYRHRSLQVIADLAQRDFDEGRPFDAMEALAYAGEHQQHNLPIAWLRARIQVHLDEVDEAIQWLEFVLALDANHAQAKAELERLKPRKKRGWFSFL